LMNLNQVFPGSFFVVVSWLSDVSYLYGKLRSIFPIDGFSIQNI
jgi:hypothetical protein